MQSSVMSSSTQFVEVDLNDPYERYMYNMFYAECSLEEADMCRSQGDIVAMRQCLDQAFDQMDVPPLGYPPYLFDVHLRSILRVLYTDATEDELDSILVIPVVMIAG